ncbi:MAG: chemotaxis protein CheW [Polyangiaceae bacterium]|jgi:purine-binding chemotaxis protein CheW|nr:chemotaxis protein CheW [Polyangiaceae bacterium]
MIGPASAWTDSTTPDVLQLVGFRVDHWRFAVRLAQVRTSVMPCAVTRVFHTPAFVLGIISLHGTVVAVLDLGRLLGFQASRAKHARFLVISDAGMDAAIPVHEVFRLPAIPRELLETVPPHVAPENRSLLEGILNTSSLPEVASVSAQDTITLIDAGTLFNAPVLRSLRGQG